MGLKSDTFITELSFIKNSSIEYFVKTALDQIVPDYFFEMSSSTSGKYHPQYALGQGGLVRHTKAAVRIAVELFRIDKWFDEYQKDIIVASLILHDCWKLGLEGSEYVITEHPKVASFAIRDFGLNTNSELPENTIKEIASAIETHMGQWVHNHDNEQVLEPPKTRIQNFVHMCDYLASRKCLEFNFDIVTERK